MTRRLGRSWKRSRACPQTLRSLSADDSTEGSLDGKSGAHGTSILAGHKRETKKCPSFLPRGFYSWSSPDGKTERVTPFAVVLLLVLLAVYVLNQADRLVLPVVIPNGLRCDEGKEDCGSYNASGVGGNGSSAHSNGTSSSRNCIQFDDDQQGLLTGPAFTVIYVLAGLPLARLADTRSRPLVLVLGLTFWSVMVLVTGFTTKFWELLVLRILLGVGEASCNPVAYSLLADFFPSQHRAFALSVYHYGVYLGGGLGWMMGAVSHPLNWRWTFHILGIAGLVMVPLAVLSMWEPASVKASREARRRGKTSYSIREVLVYLLKNPPFLLLLVAASVRNIPGYALGAWLPTFFKRNYGASDYGIPVGLAIIFGGGLGSFLGGFVSDRLSSRWRGSKPFVIAGSQLVAAPCIIAVLLAPTARESYGLLFLAYLTAETWLGPAAAIVQDVCMPAMRAQASAVYIGVITIIASSGPVIVSAPSSN
ncbi:Protein spinster [Geodia barretti]|uniref:Protein spinster n=2 Tax=Geodia barretti TaxID=519541 RepID=A0AA35S2R8_GEOBA|nr:Protein spinster [Geodia barretti]